MGLLSWIVLGFLAGTIAGLATGNRGQGCITKIAVGILGALIGAALARAAGLHDVVIDRFTLKNVLVAAAGAALLLLVLQAVGIGNRRRR
jgi:uncharacterized membrane protein YeaQ/YmgE (transglycosylase-associated protein family)